MEALSTTLQEVTLPMPSSCCRLKLMAEGIKRRNFLKKQTFVIGTMIIGLASIGVCYWLLYNRTPATADPFDTQLLASINFPLYYPTQLPAGYHVDSKSVSQPQPGVVVLILRGPKNQKIYISQEVRPTTFDFGGYYNNFTDRSLTVTDAGTIAVGHTNDGYTSIGSLATNRTWIIANTSAPLGLDKLTALLGSLAVSH